MKAKKQNKVYTIDKSLKSSYLKDGYDIYDDEGKLLERSPASKVAYADYKKVLDELEAVKEENAALKAAGSLKGDGLANMDVEELKEYAETHQINIGRATTKEGILEKIQESMNQ